jgi:hypothetical protein
VVKEHDLLNYHAVIDVPGDRAGTTWAIYWYFILHFGDLAVLNTAIWSVVKLIN